MSKLLQLRGGTTAEHTSFTGAVRELTVDTDKDTLVVHDGTTAGGHVLPRTKADIDALNINADTLDGKQLATIESEYQAFANTAAANVVDSAPGTLDTLNELAAALGDDPNFATTVTNSIATKLPLAGGTMTGAITFAAGQTFDGRDVSADGTKLDGIEAGADVTDTANVSAAGAAMETGAAFTGNVTFGDNDKAIFGAASNLEIYHNNGYTNIRENGTGNLDIWGDSIYFYNSAGTKTYAAFVSDGAVTLYHNNSAKLATSASGITVTGTLDINTNDAAGNTIDIIGEGSTNGAAICTNWATGSAYLDFRLGGLTTANTEMRLYNGGDLHVDGNVIAYSTTISDERLKKDIVKIDSALDKVDQINGYTFTYTTDGKKSAGVIAQEVEKVLPSAITESTLPLKVGEDDKTEYKTVQYDQLIGLLVEAVKELKAEVAELKGV